MRILVINGPNLNLLGTRETDIYGMMTLEALNSELIEYGKTLNIDIECHQSNLEGILIDLLHHAHHAHFDGVILNAAAYTHYSYALYDAIKAIDVPVVEVHLSNPEKRSESFRRVSLIKDACAATFQGQHKNSYFKALEYLRTHYQKHS